MIAFLMIVYLAILFVLVRFKIVPWNTFWKVSPVIVFLLLMIGLIIPMSWGAPSGPILVIRNSVQIVPDVVGEVIDVPVTANVPLRKGDVLFRLDPVPYQSQLGQIEAQLKLAEARLEQIGELQRKDAASLFNLQEREAAVDQLRAQREGAKWNLDKTTVLAPADGYVTNLALRQGARVASAPVMAFIETGETIIGVQIQQIYARYLAPGQEVELTFKFYPGKIYTGRVESVLQATSTGQTQTSGTAVAPTNIEAAPLAIRIKPDDPDVAARLPAGSTGTGAIYTDHVQFAQVIQRVILRQTAILNYVIPF
jgi:multidrug resistance efflux pump